MSASRPNVLLVVLDTARADAFEPYGAPAGATPAVAQQARRGAAAARAFAPSCWTVPSHASMFTGLLPRTLGLGRSAGNSPQGYRATLEQHADRLLSTVLSGAGYRTVGVSANLWVSPDSGFDTGFDEFTYVRSARRASLTDPSWSARLRWELEAVRARADDGAAEIERLLARHMAGTGEDGARAPFFWFVNLVECHTPYLPPVPYEQRGWRQRVRSARDARAYQTFAAMSRASLTREAPPVDALERMHYAYRRSVKLMDDWLARLLDALDRHGVHDETLLLVTSDHGENLGEQGLMGHCFSLDDRLVHVPLVAAGPGAPALDGVTSLADLPALVAEAVGLESHPYGAVPQRQVAVAQLDAPAGRDDDISHQVRADLHLDDDAFERMVTPLTAATDGRWKLLARGAEEELYDLATDPLERFPRAASSQPDVVARLREALHRAEQEAVDPSAPVVAPDGEDDEAADLRARMELLGYL